MRGLLKLTWLEIKIFIREPLGLFGTVGIPVLVFVVLTRLVGQRLPVAGSRAAVVAGVNVAVVAAVLMAVSAVISLVTIISIYREGGILKRLRATPLRPQTILTAHVLVKLLFTVVTAVLMLVAGRRYYALVGDVRVFSFMLALSAATAAILSIGFLIASIVPTARFAQPIATFVFYPMLAVSGLFFPVSRLPTVLAAVAHAMPLTYAVSLLDGIWNGNPWTAHLGDVAGLIATSAVFTLLAARVFRWE